MLRRNMQRIIAIALTVTINILTITNINVYAVENNTEYTYTYSGDIQEFTAPSTGKYYIELYGASGGGAKEENGGLGGKTTGYIKLRAGQKLYIAVGQQGELNGTATYNGGGAGGNGTYSGGGATSITATNRGVLSNYETYKEEVIAVAGGGGGAGVNQTYQSFNDQDAITIGPGGGESSYTVWEGESHYYGEIKTYSYGGSITSGYAFGYGQDSDSLLGGAGGGGFYGGTNSNNSKAGGGGGSGYINYNDITDGASISNQNFGNGYATIKYVGTYNVTVDILLDSKGTWNGIENDIITVEYECGTEQNFPNPVGYQGCTFSGWEILNGDCTIQNEKISIGLENIKLLAKFDTLLNLNITKSINSKTINLDWVDATSIDKDYEVYRKYDEDWINICETGEAGAGGTPITYNYTKTIKTYQADNTGIYKLEVYGASGQGATRFRGNNYGYGGYSSGAIKMYKGDKIYVAVGGAGSGITGGYNGGGSGKKTIHWNLGIPYYGGGGGGATHIAKRSGLLYQLEYYKNDVLIVAGGGGGCDDWQIPSENDPNLGYNEGLGGNGGGIVSTSGIRFYNGNAIKQTAISTQTSGYRFGLGQSSTGSDEGPGGGGWYGGYQGCDGNAGGSGGSGYIGGVSNGESQAGVRKGNGYAIITPVQIFYKFNTQYLYNVKLHDVDAPEMPSNAKYIKGDESYIEWKESNDIGTDNQFYVQSYEKDTYTEVNKSPVVSEFYTSGLSGYYYLIDNNANTIVNNNNGTFVETPKVGYIEGNGIEYIHIASVDCEGNISNTYTYEIATYTVKHYKQNLDLDTYTLVETETFKDNVGTVATPNVKNYNGFTSPSVQSVTVQEGGSTVISYYYTRNYYNLILNHDDGMQETLGGGKYLFEQSVKIDATVKEGYSWKNWNGTYDTTIKNYRFTMPSSDVTMMANTIPNHYTIVFNGNRATGGNTASMTCTYDVSTTLTANGFTREGYEFIGWGTSPNQEKPTYTDKQTVKNLKNTDGAVLDLYAIWGKPITLTFNFNGGKFNDSTANQVLNYTMYNSELSHTFDIKQYYGGFKNNRISANKGINNKLTKTDTNGIQYRFLGYSLNPNATVPDSNFDVYNIKERTENYTIRDNTTLYAVWEPVLQMTVQLSAPQHSGVMQLTSDVPVTTTLGNFKISSGTRSTDIPSSATASVNSATIGTNVTNKDLVTYTVSAKGASNIKFSTAADSRILDIYTYGNNNTWFDKLNTIDKFEYTIDNFSNTTSSFTIPQYIGTTKSYKTSNPESATGTSVYAIKFTCTQPSYYYSKYWNSPETTSVYGILFLNPTLPDDNTNILPPSAVEDGAYEFETILN